MNYQAPLKIALLGSVSDFADESICCNSGRATIMARQFQRDRIRFRFFTQNHNRSAETGPGQASTDYTGQSLCD
jgi:hypothetical protein